MPTKLLKPFLSLGFLLLIAPMLAGATPGVGEEVVGKVTEITGSAVGTVLARLFRARKQLERALWDAVKRAERGDS